MTDLIPGVFSMSSGRLLLLLRRVAAGEDPDEVFVEEYANAEHGPLADWIERHSVQS